MTETEYTLLVGLLRYFRKSLGANFVDTTYHTDMADEIQKTQQALDTFREV
jgi:hypothetical protein